MKLKKVMALTMAGAMAATTLTACGSSSSTTETTKAAETTAAAAADTTAAAAADNGSSDAETVLQPFRLSGTIWRRKLRRSSKRNPAARWQSRSTRIPSLVISLP